MFYRYFQEARDQEKNQWVQNSEQAYSTIDGAARGCEAYYRRHPDKTALQGILDWTGHQGPPPFYISDGEFQIIPVLRKVLAA
jgi:hypothetical protein